MNDSSATIHVTNRDQNRHINFFLLLIPSIVFAVTLAFFLRNKWTDTTPAKNEAVKVETSQIKIGEKSVSVKLAKNPEDQARGLSGVNALPENEGMLFLFPGKARPPFWMKDMLISLDFIWIADGKVTQIIQNVDAPLEGTPDSKLKLYIPNDLVDSVLEVNSGFVSKNNIKVGDAVDLSQI